MILHKGIRRKTTDVTDDYGQAYYAQNWRFKRMGEMGRRPGIGKSNMAQLAGPVLSMICGNLYFPYLVQVTTGGNVTSTLNPQGLWNNPVMFRPPGQGGEPSAPQIISITPAPADGQVAPAGIVVFTSVVNYDGLSGNLNYLWDDPMVDLINTTSANANSPLNLSTCSFDFSSIIPGTYAGILTVFTDRNGFLDVFPYTYTQT